MKFYKVHKSLFVLFFIFICITAHSQRPVILTTDGGSGIPNLPGPLGRVTQQQGGNSDSLRRRDHSEDSVSIRLYYLDTTRGHTFDSSLNDFTLRYPIPATHIYLGNTGTATRSLLFTPRLQSGWDPGFHAFDVYKWRVEKARFFNTTRPYTELGYSLASKAEQTIEILHTQNIKYNWNVSFQYRLITSPGFFRNQRTNHNNYQVTSWYQSPNRRYNNYLIVINNKLMAGENGGIRKDFDYLNSPIYARDRFTVPTNLGGEPSFGSDLFSSALYTGRKEQELTVLLRQQYDVGRKDSIVTDSTIIPLFFPRVRFEHTLKYGSNNYLYQDFAVRDGKQNNDPDSTYYRNVYNITLNNDSVLLQDRWKEISNDFSFYQFPDEKNLQQFIRLGAELQLLRGEFQRSNASLYNIIGHGEYRNRTKNGKWNILSFAKLHLAGFNASDYHAYISLERLLNKNLGNLQLGFENINRTPSFIFNQQSSFYIDAPKTFSKENTLHFFASAIEPKTGIRLRGDYFILSNYTYVKNFHQLEQEAALFNVLRVAASKTFKFGRYWNLYSDLYVQQKTGAVEVNMPLLFTRNRFAFEGNFFRNLNISTGAEVRYHTPYKADNYSPVLGRFFYQDSTTISNLPDVAAFLHMRIRSFKAYVRAENLNTLDLNGGLRFNRNNFAAPDYPTPGLVIRLGIYWSFVN